MRIPWMIGAPVALVAGMGCAALGERPASAVASTELCAGLQAVEQQVIALYEEGGVIDAAPIHARGNAALPSTRAGLRGAPRYVVGASLYVPAPPGMGEAYAERLLTCHAFASATPGSDPADPLAVRGVQSVVVRRRGPTLAIQVVGEDAASGEGIWLRARRLRDQPMEVEVRQISQSDAAETSL